MSKFQVCILLAAIVGVALASVYRSGRTGPGRYYGSGNVVGAHGKWGYWSAWSNCDAHCGGGYKIRTRQCHRPQYSLFGSGSCRGSSTDRAACNTHYCVVNGGWSNWGAFSDCSKYCGGGVRIKYRTCTNPAPAYGGSDCYGASSYTESCNTHYCAVHGGWSQWTLYSECSSKCGSGYRTRSRTCTNPAPLYGGNKCYGSNTYTESCIGYHCPVNGGWTQWGAYSACSKNCGGGYKTRSRYCTNPAPAYGGANCYGDSTHRVQCNTHYCKAHGYGGSHY